MQGNQPPPPQDEDVAANPELKGKRFMHIFEATVEATEQQRVVGWVGLGGGVGLGWVVLLGWVEM